jgi:hypothetical protein
VVVAAAHTILWLQLLVEVGEVDLIYKPPVRLQVPLLVLFKVIAVVMVVMAVTIPIQVEVVVVLVVQAFHQIQPI